MKILKSLNIKQKITIKYLLKLKYSDSYQILNDLKPKQIILHRH